MSWKHSWEYAVSFCSCNCSIVIAQSCKSMVFFTCFFKKYIYVKIKIKSTFKIYSKQLNFCLIQNLSIINMYICGFFIAYEKATFSCICHCFFENQWNIFPNVLWRTYIMLYKMFACFDSMRIFYIFSLVV